MRRAALLLCLLTSPAWAGEFSGVVTRVADGDTLTVGKTKVRLCGISAPEMRQRGGMEAKRALTDLAMGKRATCVPVGSGTYCDGRSPARSYSRIVATCRVDGVDLARAMVDAGAAADWPKFSGGAYGGE